MVIVLDAIISALELFERDFLQGGKVLATLSMQKPGVSACSSFAISVKHLLWEGRD